MTESWSNFERLQRQGLEARRQGRYADARQFLLQAADAALQAAKDAQMPEARQRLSGAAGKLLELARDCERAESPPPGVKAMTAGGAAASTSDSPNPSSDCGSASNGDKKTASPPAPIRRRATYEIFERYRDGGIAAWRRRDWMTAESSFAHAAETIEMLANETTDAEQRDVRLETARKLRDKAEEAASNSRGARGAKASQRSTSAAPPQGDDRQAEGGTSADQWLIKERPSQRFADIAGLEEVKGDIRLKMIYPFSHPELAAKFGVRGGGGVLLYGPPGTGKTMLAKATAGELDAAFFRVTAADMLSKWVGEAEQNIKKLFDAAAAEKRSVIFIDEIESLVPARQDEGSGIMQRVVPQILQGMEGFDKKSSQSVLFMGATNVPWQLDPAVLRPGRFDEKVYIPLPDLPARRKLLELYLAERPVSSDVNFDALAQRLEGFSGADVKYICDRAATIPFLQSVATGQEGVIDNAILDEVIVSTRKSVTPEMIRRFEAWAGTSANG